MNTDDLNFAYKVRHALNEQLDHLPSATTDKLAAARRAALKRKKADAPLRVARQWLALNAGGAFSSFGWANRVAVALPLLAMVIGLAGIYQHEQQQRIAEIAELDAAVLSDELPLNAYLDHGFDAYLLQQQQQQPQQRAQ
jgi:hypothetical protein